MFDAGELSQRFSVRDAYVVYLCLRFGGNYAAHRRAQRLAVALAGREQLLGPPQRPREHKRRLPIVRGEEGVTTAHRQAVRLPNGGHGDDLDVEVQVTHQPSDNGELLRVLPPEVRALRPDDLEQLRNDGSDAAKVARTVFALQRVRNALNFYERRGLRRIDLGGLRQEHDVDALIAQQRQVAFRVARVAGEVFGI
ncbi:MAG: hypothetical protein IIA44_01015, partial [Acidobacteria bacterium]|nr:hypothetical protein [Acidobacteriota bacterium]